MKIRLPTVTERRFSKSEKAVGSHSDIAGRPPGKRPGRITVDSRLSPRQRCETLIHESLHEYFPWLEEYAVQDTADKIERILYRDGYRRIYQKQWRGRR
jgi:hypothetical protein